MLSIPRRRFLSSALIAGGAFGFSATMPAWARGAMSGSVRKGIDEVSGTSIDLAIGRGQFSTGGRSGGAIAVNGTVPGPLVRLREGQDVRLNVTNNLDEDSSIHWHGILLPFQDCRNRRGIMAQSLSILRVKTR